MIYSISSELAAPRRRPIWWNEWTPPFRNWGIGDFDSPRECAPGQHLLRVVCSESDPDCHPYHCVEHVLAPQDVTLDHGAVVRLGRHGLGNGGEAIQIGEAVAPGAVAAGGAIAAGASTAAIAVPIAGAVFAVGALIYSWIQRRGAQKVAATQIVNEAEPYLQKNLEAYMGGGHSVPERQQALQTFDAVWAFVEKNCSNPSLGAAGERCISERSPGGHVPGVSRPGSWFEWYRDPIEQDQPVPGPLASQGADAAGFSLADLSTGVDLRFLALAGVALLAVVIL